MKIQTAAHIALRYLFSRKSHSTVKAISAISVTGIAAASCALICVLSVFNGFSEFLSDGNTALAPDLAVFPAHGKRIDNGDTLAHEISAIKGVKDVAEVVEENALAIFDNRELPVKVTGTDSEKLRRNTSIERLIKPGGSYITKGHTTESVELDSDELTEENILSEFESQDDAEAGSIVSIGVAGRFGVSPSTQNSLRLYAPRRIGKVSIANPAESFVTEPIHVDGVFQTNDSRIDDATVIVDTETARRLFQYTNECTRLDITLQADADAVNVARHIENLTAGNATIRLREELQSEDFQMVSIEKWITFMLLTFILLIASFNIISSLSMIIIEKQENMHTLRCLGASGNDIGMIFRFEGLYTITLGAVAGIILGIILCLLQQHFGFIQLNGDSDTLIIKAYPVALKWTDIPICLIPIAIVGIITSEISAAFAKARSRQ